MSFVVGLTGGIGSGKSAAAACFSALGVPIVDTDVIAHELTVAGGAAIAPIRAAFGPTLMTGEGALDRAAMRRHVFVAPAERKRLEAIMHPLIRASAEAQICRLARADFPYIILVVPLLLESGSYREHVNRVVVVDCPEEMQIARVMARSTLTRDEVMAIMAAQSGRQERLAMADDIIANDAGLDALQARIAALHATYLKLAKLGVNHAKTAP
jgi:dephospho-CoA kinase